MSNRPWEPGDRLPKNSKDSDIANYAGRARNVVKDLRDQRASFNKEENARKSALQNIKANTPNYTDKMFTPDLPKHSGSTVSHRGSANSYNDGPTPAAKKLLEIRSQIQDRLAKELPVF